MSFLEPTLTLHSKGLDCPQVGKTRSDTGDTIVIATSPDEIGSIFVNSQSALVMTAGKMKLRALNRKGVRNGNAASIPLMSSSGLDGPGDTPRLIYLSNFREKHYDRTDGREQQKWMRA